MTARTETRIRCDGDAVGGCALTFVSSNSIGNARTEARRHGWENRG